MLLKQFGVMADVCRRILDTWGALKVVLIQVITTVAGIAVTIGYGVDLLVIVLQEVSTVSRQYMTLM